MLSELLFNFAMFIFFIPSQIWEFFLAKFANSYRILSYCVPLLVFIEVIWILLTCFLTLTVLSLSALCSLVNI